MQQSWYEALSKQFVGYPAWAVDLGIFGVLFLVIGFLAKFFGKLFWFALLAIALGFGLVYYFNVAPEFLLQVKEFFGLQDLQMLGDIPTLFIGWARLHVFAALGAALGLIVGYSIG